MKKMIVFISFVFMTNTLMSQKIQKGDNGLYGLAVKSNGEIKWITTPQYSRIKKNANNNTFYVCNENGRWGIITAEGRKVISCNYTTPNAANEIYQDYLDLSSNKYASSHTDLWSNASNSSIETENSTFTLTRDYTSYIKNYVEQKINQWQKKGEYEKTADYQKRVTESTRRTMIEELTKEVYDECLQKIQDKELRMILGEYDADNETFLVTTEIGDFVLPVSISIAPNFKKLWPKIICDNTYDIINGKIVLRSSTFTLNNKVLASYSDQNHALYAQTNINYNFDPIEVPLQGETSINQPRITQNNIQIGKSDVDVNIPITKSNDNNKTFALIIANENYRGEVPVAFAKNDGTSIEKYFTQTLGIPQKNIHFIIDATKNDMIREVDWLRNISNVYNDDISILVYYAGHGVPNETTGNACLVPIDGVGSNPKTLYQLSEFYDEIGNIPTKLTLVFLDACFSGAVRGSGMLASARGIALKAKQDTPLKNMVIISAAQGDETAWPYDEKYHGLFTYFLLKKLQDSNGEATIGQLADYIKEQVGRHSIVVNSKKQTPSISVSPKMVEVWRNMKIR